MHEASQGDCVCIVGSGPTGVVAATALVEAGVTVVMLESGSAFPRRTHIRLGGVDLLRPAAPRLALEPIGGVDFLDTGGDSTRWIRANHLGGLSNYWSGIALRYAREDFTEGERIHAMYRWPVSYDNLEPYYAKAEALLQIRGGTENCETLPACHVAYERTIGREWARFARLCRDRGRDLAVLPDANGPATVISTRGTPHNFALRLLGRLQNCGRFRLITDAHVTRVLLDPHKPAARAVEYVDTRTGVFARIKAKAVVLAAGPLASTQILLNSQSGAFPQGLGNSHGILGRYLHDHPLEYTRVEGDFRFRRLDNRRRGGLYVTRMQYANSAPLRATALLLYGGTVFGMLPYLVLPQNWDYLKLLKHMLAVRRGSAQRGIASLNGSLMYICCFGTQVPCYDNCVRLDPARKDRYGVPLLQISARFSAGELNDMSEAAALIPSILEEAGSRVLRVTSALQAQGTSVHYGGTVRMHDSPKYGVLDKWNRLHDVPNVLVVDASCYTTCTEKNPTLTALALSMRAAERLGAEGRS